MRVIATAGHVDHGKSTLVRALTGIDPDRLREEQQREMTIDLGFAWMTLPNGEPVGVVDVPGHIDFIENMLAGVGGVDAALLVIAADEGPMPQTVEHLAILGLLQVRCGVVALSKLDLISDPTWVALVDDEVRRLLAGTPLAGAAIVPVSAKTGQGLAALRAALARALADAPARRDLGRPRLPVDRVFTLPGFGVVVTGTLSDGVFEVGDEVEVITQRGETLPARIRGLQTHKQKVTRAQIGSRLAVNLSGIAAERIARGCVVARPGALAPTTLVDAWLEVLSAPARQATAMPRAFALRHNAEVKIFSGAAHSIARVRLLEGDALTPGESGWTQLQLAAPMALANGDRFVVRLPSPSVTLGGGVIVNAHPQMRYRRKGGRADAQVLKRLATLRRGSPAERLLQALEELAFASPAEAAARAQLEAEDLQAALADLSERGAIVIAPDAKGGRILSCRETWQRMRHSAQEVLEAYHKAHPLAEGMPREALRGQLGLPAEVFDALLKSGHDSSDSTRFVDSGGVVRLAAHEIRFDADQRAAVDALLARCRTQPWATPSVKEARAAVGDPVYEVMLRRRMLVQLNDEVVLLPETYAQAVEQVRDFIAREGSMTAAQARDLFGTTRKYALALMEHLDAIGVTCRRGDARVLKG
ncbi:MAG: selenocysteine-specific translation elongation factor [Chloroflexi bacterium]|jgi:selenocysteine-specific elongation factor|uniref:Selenocysteine-specific elongation factor n=1 Tax=Candidatus Thermofonsia Clade 3 bacterium TaxID=2364212 RepID=A0A2M8QAP2_9CHLR|nr:selenocysteine-specific translation elongation factor [Candidatus Roseilinea sp. NK_OTU-006]PJF46855.1 MAG: selenocysteine-specific translation elongation factor [Candidatus Thermofonsia Clade 3 bacterium]RMG65448.1 MAG: selenocysteine-specific translation elongation factor [Chloroflexota bacterium]